MDQSTPRHPIVAALLDVEEQMHNCPETSVYLRNLMQGLLEHASQELEPDPDE